MFCVSNRFCVALPSYHVAVATRKRVLHFVAFKFIYSYTLTSTSHFNVYRQTEIEWVAKRIFVTHSQFSMKDTRAHTQMLTWLQKQRRTHTHTLSGMVNLISAHKNANWKHAPQNCADAIFPFPFAGIWFVWFHLWWEKNVHVCALYNRIHPQTFNRLLYCASSAHRKEFFINANFRLNSFAQRRDDVCVKSSTFYIN